eukprot:m.139838 g.139838  ORF g.139838 m.139838 type:complete len:400 (-) comp30085_c0_seq1:243-1442(-)
MFVCSRGRVGVICNTMWKHTIVKMGQTRFISHARPTLLRSTSQTRDPSRTHTLHSEPERKIEHHDVSPIDWDTLKFAYTRTDSHMEYTYRGGNWDQGTVCEDAMVQVHVMSASLHYGQQLFEGMKAFRREDNQIQIFQPDNANAIRLQKGCDRLCMPAVPTHMFNTAVVRAVQNNQRWVPPFGKGALYIRPFMIGCGPQLGLAPAPDYKFLVQVMPVGSYYGSDFEGLEALMMLDYDRAAPRGTGHVKCGGNYGSDLYPNKFASSRGFQICLYTDAATHSYVEEFSTSNFVAISESGAYITPKSSTVLNSITNRALMKLARDQGLTIEQRDIPIAELPTLQEVAAVGTAVVLNPIKSITAGPEKYSYGKLSILARLRDELYSIQNGTVPDRHKWCMVVE